MDGSLMGGIPWMDVPRQTKVNDVTLEVMVLQSAREFYGNGWWQHIDVVHVTSTHDDVIAHGAVRQWWWAVLHSFAMTVGVATKKNVFLFGSFKSLQPPPPMSLWEREKKKWKREKKKKKRALKLVPGYVTPRLVSFFLALSILALLVGRSVTTQAPSSNRNTSNNNTGSKKKFRNS